MLPKFLLATNSQQRLGYIYVVHTEKPRFILEGSEDDFENDKQIYWIDKPELPQIEIDTLIAEAEYFILQFQCLFVVFQMYIGRSHII